MRRVYSYADDETRVEQGQGRCSKTKISDNTKTWMDGYVRNEMSVVDVDAKRWKEKKTRPEKVRKALGEN